ncbi:MAG: hypothetical protein COA42_06915 [Alteromonadaceae bacterium]|nr:MAG: hypothetical protein COA42_06915 [Alteromonadaceae bacterium]
MSNFIKPNPPLLVKLLILKFILISTAAVILFIAHRYFKIDLPYQQLSTYIVLAYIVLGLWLARLRSTFPISEQEIFTLLVIDVLFIYLLIKSSGGGSNPFTSSLLIPIALGAALIRKWFSIPIVALSMAVYALWFFGGDENAHAHHTAAQSSFNLHIYGMWINFIISAIALFVFITYATDSVRASDAQLRSAREKILKDEQMVAVATITTSTAHALGTPLSTMAILMEQAENDGELDPESIYIANQQIQICKKHLANIVRSAKSVKSPDLVALKIGILFNELNEHVQLSHPDKDVIFNCDPAVQDASILKNQLLDMAMINLIENALDSAASTVNISAKASEESASCLNIAILDDGPGVSEEVRANLGTPFISSKPEGWGLGVYLSHSTVEQFGGKISMRVNATGGTLTEITLPLTQDGQSS